MPLSRRKTLPKIPPILLSFCFETLGMTTAQKNMGNNTEHFPLCIEYCL